MTAGGGKGPQMPIMRFEINLASRDYRWVRRIQVALWLAAVLGLICVGVEIQLFVGYRQDVARLDRSLQRLHAEQKVFRDKLAQRGLKNVTPQVVADISKQVASANKIIATKAFSWTLLLSDLEDVMPPNISLTAITPSSKTQMITLKGTALALGDITRLLKRFEESPRFTDVLLSDQQNTKERRVGFTMSVQYRSRTP